MKISINCNNSSFERINIAYGIHRKKESLKKNPNKKIKKFTTIFCKEIILSIVLFIVMLIITNNTLPESFLIIWSCIMGYEMVSLISIAVQYFQNKNSKSIFTIDKYGIGDEDLAGRIIKYRWDKIELIVIIDDSIYVISDFMILLFSNIEDKNKTIEVIKKYNKKATLIVK